MRYVAVGDSFTEGIGDDVGDGAVRGWADLVAAGLAAATGEPIQYANLAVRGRLLGPIVDDQIPAALALAPVPTLMTFNGGGNDMMRPGIDLDALLARTETAIRQVLDAGVRLVLLSGADPSAGLPFGRVIHRRGMALTEGVEKLAARYDLTLVNAFADAEIRRPVYWSPDRLHLGPVGHRRVASLVLAALGHPVAAHAVEPAPTARRRVSDEARYYREHVLPWVNRHLRGRSSGDGRTGKHPNWVPVEPVPSGAAPLG
ncbi:MAG TPA: SGNH/GDSL hydrolase family protein [Jatrophihabitans sp.]|uniref:SGNH/GDSL hydrolase family protein n=1 Tax=Jatrophihabitans sp. TaxID=1932789 RepID=UPI002DFA8B92|nr:SGNH/GDSL hydrolase family protein [Jatrophihabitans sp.]